MGDAIIRSSEMGTILFFANPVNEYKKFIYTIHKHNSGYKTLFTDFDRGKFE